MKNIIAENKKYVRAVIRKLTGSDNEDLEQDVYIKVWQNRQKYREEGKLKQWICMITANLCRDKWRSKQEKGIHLETHDDTVLESLSVESVAEKQIDQKQRSRLILKAVDNLPKLYRDVIVLYEFEEYPLEKIAARLKVPLGTIKSRLHNARQILREQLSFLQGDTK